MLGSTSFVIDTLTSELLERITYQPYGATEADFRPTDWGSFREPYRFTGKEDDSEVGLAYFGARYYAPALQRFISPDPKVIHQLGGDQNPYAYVSGNVTAAVDPNGLDEVPSGDLLPSSSPWSTWNTTTTLSPFQSSLGGQYPPGDAEYGLYNYLNGIVAGLYGMAPGSFFLDAFTENYIKNAIPGPVGTQGDLDAYIAGYAAGGSVSLAAGGFLAGRAAEGVSAFAGLVEGAEGVTTTAELTLSGAEGLEEESRAGATVGDIQSMEGLGAGNCFAAGTPVWTAHGKEPIEDIQIGDEVVARNDRTGALEIRPVARVFVRTAGDIVDVDILTAEGLEHLKVTAGHPFWVEGDGWTPADRLDAGSELWSPGALSLVTGRGHVSESRVVYNFEVEADHTYFVGDSPVLVHNACSVTSAGGAEASLVARAQQFHSALDSVAQEMRTTVALDTSAGRVIAGGGRDLTPGQRALLQAGEMYNTAPGVHAEVTAITGARQIGAQLRAIAATRDFCPFCIDYIQQSGGVITGPNTAIWPQ